MHSRRALLYMPGDDRRKIEKATTLSVDCICMDMEDGVAIHQKAEARAVIALAMRELDFGRSERCIRINSVGSGFETTEEIGSHFFSASRSSRGSQSVTRPDRKMWHRSSAP